MLRPSPAGLITALTSKLQYQRFCGSRSRFGLMQATGAYVYADRLRIIHRSRPVDSDIETGLKTPTPKPQESQAFNTL